MVSTLQVGYRRALIEAAGSCGIQPDEITEEEYRTVEEIIYDDMLHIPGFAQAITENSRINGRLLGPLLSRAQMWQNRYNFVRDRMKVIVCGDKKYKWVFGDTEHCGDCEKLNGRIYRASVWQKYDIYPRHPQLACGGFRCQCEFQETTERCTPGKPPALSGGSKEIPHVHFSFPEVAYG